MNELYSEAMYDRGLVDAKDLQARSAEMDGTALYAEEEKIPDFAAAVKVKNMLERKAGQTDGFVCKASSGRVCRLIQAYDSDTYPQEPDSAELVSQWRIVYSKDPLKALPFLQDGAVLAVSYYNKDECCTDAGHVWRSTYDGANVWAPSTNPEFWFDLGTIEAVRAGIINEPETTPTEPEPPEPEQGETGTEEPEQPETSYPEFVHPTGSHDTYRTGDRVTYNSKVYESLVDNNSYSPDEYPQGWKVVE